MSGQHKWMATFFAAMCVAAQAVVVVPHHHHGDAQSPCFNPVHCVEHLEEHGQDEHGCDHGHCAPESDDFGCVVKIDIAEVVSEQAYRAFIDGLSAVNQFFAPEIVISAEGINTLHSFTLTRWRQQPDRVDDYALIVTEAHSVRAPSFSV